MKEKQTIIAKIREKKNQKIEDADIDGMPKNNKGKILFILAIILILIIIFL